MLSELWSDLRYRLRTIVRRDAAERELDAELRFHIEHEAEKYMSRGLSRDESMRLARLAFGGLDRIKDDARDARGVSWLDATMQELRYAARGLRNKPGFTGAVTLTLALGIGANAAIFDVVDRLMFRPPPYLRDPTTVHRVYLTSIYRGEETTERSTEFTRYLDLVRWSTRFSQFAAFDEVRIPVGDGDETQPGLLGVATAGFFDFFDVRPVIGRLFAAEDDSLPLGRPVAVLGYGFWQARYAGDRNVLGKRIRLGARYFTIIGVAPEHFAGASVSASHVAWIPLSNYAGNASFQKSPTEYYTTYNWGWAEVLARRKPGVSIAEANADLTNAYIRSWNKERAEGGGGGPVQVARPHASVGPLQNMRGTGAGPEGNTLLSVGGVAIIVLLIAAANAANLLLGRALTRRREIALRFALGASRGRILLQLATESLLLAALAGVAGLAMGRWGAIGLQRVFAPTETGGPTMISGRTLLFAGGIALVTGLLAGLAPLVHARSTALATSMKTGGPNNKQRRSRMRTGLLVFQGALSMLLLVGAGLLVRSLDNVRAIPLGFDVEPVMRVTWNLREMKLPIPGQIALAERAIAAARRAPGVVSATRASTVPLSDHDSQRLIIQGVDSMSKFGRVTLQAASPEYFATMGTRLIRGRGILSTDRADQPLVAVVSQTMARTFWPGKEAIGQCMRINFRTAPCTTIVGVAEDIREVGLIKDSGLHYYVPITQRDTAAWGGFVRVQGDAATMTAAVRKAIQQELPGSGFAIALPMRDIVDPKLRSWEAGATMFAALGALALVLAAVGLYSVIAYDVAQRTQELGVRIALGAALTDVVRLVVGDGIRFAVAGIAMGAVLALMAGRLMVPLLYGVSPKDPGIFAVVTAVLLVSAIVASLLPALRATRVDPNVALRAE